MNLVIDGKALAEKVELNVAKQIESLKGKAVPTLAVILVGEDPASQIYVRNKKKKAESLGIRSIDIILPINTSQDLLMREINMLNKDPFIHGILLQLPLPKHLNPMQAIMMMDPLKDVDGFHPENVGLLNIGMPRFIPCTPKGCIKLIKTVEEDISGMNALVVGRSNVVGWPMARLLLNENCTVEIAHSKTKDLGSLAKKADIIIVAAGSKDLLKDDMIVEGKSIIVDVGINRYTDDKGDNKIKGDVDFESIIKKARAITPVPGGVGPMTIACLMENVMLAYKINREDGGK
jgi:methylenetetrahydrofolate dehydrogenase (NADP+)/methenyltetrahydrofolate cyclohydrolase